MEPSLQGFIFEGVLGKGGQGTVYNATSPTGTYLFAYFLSASLIKLALLDDYLLASSIRVGLISKRLMESVSAF